MSDFSARILDDILNGKNVIMSSKMSLVSDEVDDEEVLDELEEVDELDEEVSEDAVENEEVLDELDDVENNDVDEVDNEEISEDEEVLDELDSVDEVPTLASPSEELKAFSQLEETVDNFIINSDIDFSANPRLKEFAQKFTEELETTIDELRQEKNDSLFEGVVSSKVIKADETSDNEVKQYKAVLMRQRNAKEVNYSVFIFDEIKINKYAKKISTGISKMINAKGSTFVNRINIKNKEAHVDDVIRKFPNCLYFFYEYGTGFRLLSESKEVPIKRQEVIESNKAIKASNVNKKSAVESAAYQGEYEVAVTIFDAKGNLKKVRKKFKTEDARAKWIDKQEESGNLYQVDGYLDPEN